MMNKQTLYQAAFNESGKIRNRVVKRAKGKTPRRKDYPAVLVSCGDPTINIHKEECSRDCRGYEYKPQIAQALLKIGPIGGKSNIKGCANFVGHCAEPHAANEVIKQGSKQSIGQLLFSEAIRPRTMQIVSYCDNCKAIFKQL